MKSKTLTTIVASLILAFASGCDFNSTKVPVYGPADPNGHREVIGHYRSSHLSTGLNVDTYKQKEKLVYDSNSQ